MVIFIIVAVLICEKDVSSYKYNVSHENLTNVIHFVLFNVIYICLTFNILLSLKL